MRYNVKKKKFQILAVKLRIFSSNTNKMSIPQGSVPSKIRERKYGKKENHFL
jgi:hypothetical protein